MRRCETRHLMNGSRFHQDWTGFIDNNISRFVILNEVKNLSLQKCTLFSFAGQMLRFAQHDSKKQVSNFCYTKKVRRIKAMAAKIYY